MTDYGLKLTNPLTGSIQYDQNHKNHVLMAMGTVATVDGNNTNNVYFSGFSRLIIPIPSSAVFPALFIGSGFQFFGLTIVKGTGSASSFSLLVKAPIGTAVKFYLFDYPETVVAPTSQYGWEIFTASVGLIYHSDFKPLRLVDLYTGPDYKSALPNKTYPSGRSYAMGMLGLGYERQLSITSTGTNHTSRVDNESLMALLTANVLTATAEYGNYSTVTTGGSASGYSSLRKSHNWAYPVIDVTNY